MIVILFILNAAAKEKKNLSSWKNLIKKCLTHPFPESDNLHSVASFVFGLIICRAKKDPSVLQIQSLSMLCKAGKLTMSHFASAQRAKGLSS